MTLQEYINQENPKRLAIGSVLLEREEVQVLGLTKYDAGIEIPAIWEKYKCSGYYVEPNPYGNPILKTTTKKLTVFQLAFNPFI